MLHCVVNYLKTNCDNILLYVYIKIKWYTFDKKIILHKLYVSFLIIILLNVQRFTLLYNIFVHYYNQDPITDYLYINKQNTKQILFF